MRVRIILVVAAVALLAIAAYVGFSRTDVGIDTSCGPLFYDASHGGSCDRVNREHAAEAVAATMGAAVLIAVAALRRPKTDRQL
jgi:hypothetical protein